MNYNICHCGRELRLIKKVKTNNSLRNNIFINKFKEKHEHNDNDHYHLYKCSLNHELRLDFPNICWCGWTNL